jgi:hypothetical protein
MALAIPIISEFDGVGVKKAIKEFQQLEGAGAKANFALKKAAMASAVAFAGLAAGISLATKAAMEDAQAQAQLATALTNTTGATKAQIASTEQFISKLTLATGVADDHLRPALAALVRGTKDIEVAQRALTLAMDISQATGMDLVTVSDALAKAYQGNMRGLRSLSPEMMALIKEGASLDQVMQTLQATFGGAVAANAETAAGKMQILRNSLNEATESIGAAFLPVLESLLPVIQRFADWAGKNTDTLVKLTYAIAGTTAAVVALNFAMNANPVVAFTTYTIAATAAIAGLRAQFQNLVLPVRAAIDQLSRMLSPLLGIIDAYNAIAGILRLPKITLGKTSIPSTPGTLGPPAAVTGGATPRMPSFPSISGISPSGSSGGLSGGPSGGRTGSSSVNFGSSEMPTLGQGMGIGTGWDLSAIPLVDTPEMQAITININSMIAEASVGDTIVEALRDYNRTTGPLRVSV